MKLYLSAIEKAGETWQIIKQIPNYRVVVGQMLFRNVFELAPETLSLFGFVQQTPEDEPSDVVPESVFEMPALQRHAGTVVRMLEKVLDQMQGDDMDTLAKALISLGARHVEYGVHPAHYGKVETALLRTLAIKLGDELWTDEVRKGWAAVFKFMSTAMMSGAGTKLEIIKDRRRQLERSKSATLRLQFMSRSEGTSRLARSDSPSARCQTNCNGCTGSMFRRSDSGPPCLPCRGFERQASNASADSVPIPPRRHSDFGPILKCPSSRFTPPVKPRRHSDFGPMISNSTFSISPLDEDDEVPLMVPRIPKRGCSIVRTYEPEDASETASTSTISDYDEDSIGCF